MFQKLLIGAMGVDYTERYRRIGDKWGPEGSVSHILWELSSFFFAFFGGGGDTPDSTQESLLGELSSDFIWDMCVEGRGSNLDWAFARQTPSRPHLGS